MTARNVWEEQARDRKVRQIVRVVAKQVTIDASTAPLILATLEALDADGWARLATEAGCKRKPSATTVAAVLDEIRARAGGKTEEPGEDWTAEVEPDGDEPDWDELAQETYDHDARLDDEIDRQNSEGW